MVLGKLPGVQGRRTNLDYSGARPIALAVGAWGLFGHFVSLVYHFSLLSPSLWEMTPYRLQYCLKGPLNPKQSTNNYLDKFRHTKNNQEKQKLNFKSCNNEKYNSTFTLSELVNVIKYLCYCYRL